MTQAIGFSIKTSIPAAATLAAYQYHFMVVSTGELTVASAITDQVVGVLQENDVDAAGKPGEVVVLGGTKLLLGGTVVAGDLLATDTSGHAVKWIPGTGTTVYGVGRALEGGDSGSIINAVVDCIAPGRGA